MPPHLGVEGHYVRSVGVEIRRVVRIEETIGIILQYSFRRSKRRPSRRIARAVHIEPRLDRHAAHIGSPLLVDDLLDHLLGRTVALEGIIAGDERVGALAAATGEGRADRRLIVALGIRSVIQTGIRLGFQEKSLVDRCEIDRIRSSEAEAVRLFQHRSHPGY